MIARLPFALGLPPLAVAARAGRAAADAEDALTPRRDCAADAQAPRAAACETTGRCVTLRLRREAPAPNAPRSAAFAFAPPPAAARDAWPKTETPPPRLVRALRAPDARSIQRRRAAETARASDERSPMRRRELRTLSITACALAGRSSPRMGDS